MKRICLSFLAATALAGCTVGPNVPKLQPAPLPAAYSEQTGSLGSGRAAIAPVAWWSAFRDPLLDQMIAAGIAGNLDIKQAEARIAAADAGVRSANAGFLPTLTLGAANTLERENGSMRETTGEVSTTGATLGSEWLLDLFGQVRSRVKTAEARREAARAGDAVARLALISDLSGAYVDARYHQELVRIASRRADSARRSAGLTRSLKSQGIASDLDVARADMSAELAAAELPVYEANFRRAANRVATLMGRPAGTLLPMFEGGGQPAPAFKAEAGMPADLLRNRPDVRVAEMEFEAAVGDIGLAWAEQFPTITLSGNITPSFIDTEFKSGSLTSWSFGPTLRLPIFEGGRLRANLRAAEARATEKEAAWRSAVLKAVEDVENALVGFNRQEKVLGAAGRQVASAKRAMSLSRTAQAEGLTSLFETLEAERRYYMAAMDHALARRNVALQFIAVNVATGRGLPGPGGVGAPVTVAGR